MDFVNDPFFEKFPDISEGYYHISYSYDNTKSSDAEPFIMLTMNYYRNGNQIMPDEYFSARAKRTCRQIVVCWTETLTPELKTWIRTLFFTNENERLPWKATERLRVWRLVEENPKKLPPVIRIPSRDESATEGIRITLQ